MDTISQKYVSYGCVFISIVLLVCHDVSFFHYNNDEISNILASVLSWWQISIVSGVILFCIYVYKSIEDMKSMMNTRFGKMEGTMATGFGNINTKFGNMDTRLDTDFGEINTKLDTDFEEINTRLDTDFGEINTRFGNMDTGFGKINTRFEEINTQIVKSSEQTQKLLGDMLGGVKSDVRDPREMLRQFKKTFMQNIILVSKTGQEKADIQRKADIVFTWLDKSQFSMEDVSAVDLGIEGNALELLVRGGYMDQALKFDWEKCSLTVLPYIAQEYNNILRRGHIDIMKGVLDLCENDFPGEDVAEKAIYMAASRMIYSDFKRNLVNVTSEWIGIIQCLKDIHKKILQEPISEEYARDKIRKHISNVPEEQFNSIFERIFV